MKTAEQVTLRKPEAAPASDRDLKSLVSDLVEEAGQWAEQEVEIVRTELQEKGTEAVTALKGLLLGLIIAATACVTLLTALAIAIGSALLLTGLTPAVAYPLGFLLFSLMGALTAFLLISKSKRSISLSRLIPRRSIQSLRDSVEWAESKFKQ